MSQTFLVGEYFEGEEKKPDRSGDVSLTASPGSRKWESVLQSFDQKASETVDFLDEADSLL